MKKLMNAPGDFVDQALDGLTLANPSLVRDGESGRVIRRAEGIRKGKVGIASGGGSGHLPLFTGYVGHGLLDTCSIGNVFEGPNVGSCMDAIRLADGGRGVLRLYGNYGGDRMNFDMAGEMLEDEIRTTTVLGNDDIASAPPEESAKRRGVAGIVYAYKIAGAKAETDADLDEVTAIAAKAVASTRTIGVSLSPCQVPGSAKPTFEIADDEIEMGMGATSCALPTRSPTRWCSACWPKRPATRARRYPSSSTASVRRRWKNSSSSIVAWRRSSARAACASSSRWSGTMSPRWKWQERRSASASWTTK
jgi:dihydroxyacetone kinase-like protein